MTVAVDTNILFDILLPDPKYLERSLAQITLYGARHKLIISEVVYGELASQFTDKETLAEFISSTDIQLVNSGFEALWAASRAWREYTKIRSGEFQCVNCGNRQTLISDFLIGGHALIYANTLLTRDRGFYQRYFPELRLA